MDNIQNLETELEMLKTQNNIKRYTLIVQFNDKIFRLINTTPTGELRNELTELNILHQAILTTIL